MSDGAYIGYSKKLAFRSATPADARLLIRFGRDLYFNSLGSEDAFFRDFGANGARFPDWVRACGATNAAFAQILVEDMAEIGLVVLGCDERDGDIGRVHHFYITPDHRGQGFGGLLDDYARTTLADAGARRARLNVGAGNARAIRFYDAQGWRETVRRGGLIFMETTL